MTPPTAPSQIPQRHHSDPPTLWTFVILGSGLIHLLAFLVLSIVLMGRFQGLRSNKTLIPVNVIAFTPEARALSPGLTSPRQPAPSDRTTQTFPSQSINPQPSPTSTVSSTRSQLQETGRQSPATKSSPNPSSERSPKSNSSPNPSSERSPKSNSSPNPSSERSPEPTSPSSDDSGSFGVALGGLSLTDGSRDIPDQPATLKSGNTTEFPREYLTQLGLNPEQAIRLKVVVLIDTTGQAEPLPDYTQVLSGNISTEQAEQLAQQIVSEWRFEPTYMGNQPVEQAYNLELNITP
ncbi:MULTISPECIES: hypothetical protein [unclassified Coleofasciculus]|uniref:hypothetical protein n=1 Tax=unclassified Coleofasciculus TaxID=2692782 RepID=UPI00188228FE|nr:MULTISPECIES: hypothetical protein [unclassified Coleofasciculus]MBE9128456.1 hypothetical protein [Coleofasciculus sp. LEGE 07081]MBE9148243.1 hypothetical protein [Coleofasciculus sp. LEGE 07092]